MLEYLWYLWLKSWQRGRFLKDRKMKEGGQQSYGDKRQSHSSYGTRGKSQYRGKKPYDNDSDDLAPGTEMPPWSPGSLKVSAIAKSSGTVFLLALPSLILEMPVAYPVCSS